MLLAGEMNLVQCLKCIKDMLKLEMMARIETINYKYLGHCHTQKIKLKKALRQDDVNRKE